MLFINCVQRQATGQPKAPQAPGATGLPQAHEAAGPSEASKATEVPKIPDTAPENKNEERRVSNLEVKSWVM